MTSCAKNEGVSLLSESKKIFVTNSTTNANTGGVAGADSKCMSDANYPGSGTYKALIVAGTTRTACTTANCSGGASEHVDWVLKANTEYLRLSDDAVIGTTDENGLLQFNLDNPLDETYNYWLFTGLESDWTTYSDNCANFTDPASGLAGIGLGDKVDNDAVAYATGSCPTNGKLVCVEQ